MYNALFVDGSRCGPFSIEDILEWANDQFSSILVHGSLIVQTDTIYWRNNNDYRHQRLIGKIVPYDIGVLLTLS